MTETRKKESHVWDIDPYNWYVEPTQSTAALLTVERFTGPVWDPSCGQGNIVSTLIAAGYEAKGTDIVRRTYAKWFSGELDFLSDHDVTGAVNICMNPPFYKAKGAEAFIRKALSICTGKVAAFVDMKFLAGSGRAKGLYAELPPHRVWILTPRPSCPPGEYLLAGNEAGGGTADWCWLVRDLTAPRSHTSFDWLRGNS